MAALVGSVAASSATTNAVGTARADPASLAGQPLPEAVAKSPEQAGAQSWNRHVQNTDIIQGDPSFPAQYSGPNSLDSKGEIRETVSVDLYAGARLWPGAEAHADGLMWQGFGLSVKGEPWGRPDDSFGLAGVLNDISRVHQEFLAAGGTGILAGDGALSCGLEKVMETYYDCQAWKTVHIAFDYQFITDPAYNRARGPVSVLGARLHWTS